MQLIEITGNLFDAPALIKSTQQYRYAHCISGDCALGAGIAKQLDRRFCIKDAIRRMYGKHNQFDIGSVIRTDLVYNIVTKPYYYMKPEYETLEMGLVNVRDVAYFEGVDTLFMPRIGCGLDKLEWPYVRGIIYEVFDQSNIEIYVFSFEE